MLGYDQWGNQSSSSPPQQLIITDDPSSSSSSHRPIYDDPFSTFPQEHPSSPFSLYNTPTHQFPLYPTASVYHLTLDHNHTLHQGSAYPVLVPKDEPDYANPIGLNLGRRTYFASDHDLLTRLSRPAEPLHSPTCQADGCNADLTHAKHYHRRHKVCDFHSKAPTVITAGLTQRFCQQCSRFHLLSEFDNGKRSCRKRLADHNRRRRKSHQTANRDHRNISPSENAPSSSSQRSPSDSGPNSTSSITTGISSPRVSFESSFRQQSYE